VGDARRHWLAASVDRWDAATILGIEVHEFENLAACCGVRPGRFGRYRRSDLVEIARER
jgi:hypothetical protein